MINFGPILFCNRNMSLLLWCLCTDYGQVLQLSLLSAIAKNELKKNLLCRNIRPITFILHITVDMVHAITFLYIYITSTSLNRCKSYETKLILAQFQVVCTCTSHRLYTHISLVAALQNYCPKWNQLFTHNNWDTNYNISMMVQSKYNAVFIV